MKCLLSTEVYNTRYNTNLHFTSIYITARFVWMKAICLQFILVFNWSVNMKSCGIFLYSGLSPLYSKMCTDYVLIFIRVPERTESIFLHTLTLHVALLLIGTFSEWYRNNRGTVPQHLGHFKIFFLLRDH